MLCARTLTAIVLGIPTDSYGSELIEPLDRASTTLGVVSPGNGSHREGLTGADTSTEMDTRRFKVGDQVSAKYGRYDWGNGRVKTVNDDGTYGN